MLYRGQATDDKWCMGIACWISEATNAHTDCVKLIVFPLQQWLNERASMVRYIVLLQCDLASTTFSSSLSCVLLCNLTYRRRFFKVISTVTSIGVV